MPAPNFDMPLTGTGPFDVDVAAFEAALNAALAALDAAREALAVADIDGLTTQLAAITLSLGSLAIADVSGLQTALDGRAVTGHGHAISAVTGLQEALDALTSALGTHGHAVGDVTGLQDLLDAYTASLNLLDFYVPAEIVVTDDLTAQKQGTDLLVGWPELPLYNGTFPAATTRAIAARTAAVLPQGSSLIIDFAQTYGSAYVVSQVQTTPALLADQRAGRKLVLVGNIANGLLGILAPLLLRKIDADTPYPGELVQIENYRGQAEAASMLAPPSWLRGRKPLSVNTTGWYAHQGTEETSHLVMATGASTLDLSYMREGSKLDVRTQFGCNVYAGEGVQFAGRSANHADTSAGNIFRITKFSDGNDIVFEEIVGAPTYSTITRPAMDISILYAGQSQNELGGENGRIGGFARELQDADIITAADKADIFYIKGGTSGSAADKRSNSVNYWWDAENAQPGPAMNDCVAAIAAAVAAGQPAPTSVFWAQGEGDTEALDNGTITQAQYEGTVTAITAYLRGNGAPNAEFVGTPPGSNDDAFYFKGSMAVQDAYVNLAASLAYFSTGCAMFDVSRAYGNLHPDDRGYFTLGIRDAMAYANVINAEANDLGPQMGAVTLSNGGKTAVFDVTSAHGMTLPPALNADGTSAGPYPFGFCAVAGDVQTNDPTPLRSGSVQLINFKQFRVTLNSDTDLTGARLYSMPGQFPEARLHNHIRDNRAHGFTAGVPMPFQRSAVLA